MITSTLCNKTMNFIKNNYNLLSIDYYNLPLFTNIVVDQFIIYLINFRNNNSTY